MDKYLPVSGMFDADGVLHLVTGFLTETLSFEQWPAEQMDLKDQLWVELHNVKGDVLIRYALPIIPACALPEDPEKYEGIPPFTVSGHVPFPDDTASIRYIRFDQVILEQWVPVDGPMVYFTWDPKFTPPKGMQKVTWEVKHAGKEKIFHILQHSRDQGASWMPLTLPIESEWAEIDFDQLAGGEVVLRLLTSDGVNTALTVSQPFDLPVKPCTPIILSPLTDDKLTSGEPVWLVGNGYYLEEGEFETSWFRWYSDIDGELGYGPIIETILSAGEHTITLQAGRPGREGKLRVIVSVTK